MYETPQNAELATQPQKAPEYMVREMFAAEDNTQAFEAVLEQVGEANLADLTAAYYTRPSYVNAIDAPRTLPEDHPLRAKISQLDLEEVENPVEKLVYTQLRTSWQEQAEGRQAASENAIAGLLLPGVIREHSIETARAVMQNCMNDSLYKTASGGMQGVLRGVLDEVGRKYIDDPVYERSRDSKFSDRVGMAFDAMHVAEHATDMGMTHLSPDREFFLRAACDELIKIDADPDPATIYHVRDLANSTNLTLARTVQTQLVHNPYHTYGVIKAMTNEPRMERVLSKPSDALTSLLSILDREQGCNPAVFAKAASGLVAEYYAQASKAPAQALQHYTDRFSELAKDVAAIAEDEGANEMFRNFLQANAPMSAKMESRALRTFRTLAHFHAAEQVSGLENLDSIENYLVDVLHTKLSDSETPLDDDQKSRLLECLGAVDPLMIYSRKFMGNAAYKQQLNGLMSSVADGTYETWHRGDGSSASMHEMIEAGYLPQNLTPQQYAEWCTDGKLSSYEQLTSSAAETAEAIRSSVARGSMDITLLAPGFSLDKRSLDMAVSDRQLLGRLNGAINGQARGQKEGPLRPDQVQTIRQSLGELGQHAGIQSLLGRLEAGEDVGAVKWQIEGTRAQLEQLRLLIRIANVDAQEVAVGALLSEPNSEGKRGVQRQLGDALAYLQKELPTELQFIPQGVSQLLESAQTQNGEMVLMTAEDTIDPKVTLEIGETPQRSCQHYETGGYNDGLIGYFGPDVKIGIVRNEKGNIVARSIVRLMEDENGDAVLFAEPIYQSIVSPQVQTMLAEHFQKKAAKMGVRLEGSLSGGQPSGRMLRVRTLKMPAVYSDSAVGQHLATGELAVQA